MRVRSHVAASVVVSGGIYATTGSLLMTAVSFAAGWLVDCDHFLDYVLEHGPRFDYQYFFRTFSEHRYRRARLFLHGWEWPAALLWAAWQTGWHPVAVGLAAGWFHHLVLDQSGNVCRLHAYSIVGRALHRFRYHESFGPGPGERT